jgi:hypothetical protein
MNVRSCIYVTIATSIASAAHADHMRCGSLLVNESTSVADLLAKCGEPKSKDVKSEDVLTRNPDTGFIRKIGTKTTERWIYQRSSGSLPMAVTIVDGKVNSVERAD